MLLHINPQNPQARKMEQVIAVLRRGGVIIYPTDTRYGLGCDIHQKKAVQKLCRIKGIDPNKAYLSCVCENIKIIGTYASQVSTPVYKLMRQALPGPYTFILRASKAIPRHFQHKKTVGIRVPSHHISTQLAGLLGNPIASISLPWDEDQVEFNTHPELIHERYGHLVDFVIDGGPGSIEESTVIDASQGAHSLTLLRRGKGPVDQWEDRLMIA